MTRTLLVGCSFLARLTYRLQDDDFHINAHRYQILASPGSGNQALAARTIYQATQEKYDQIIVLWSGINRLDFPISQELQQTYAPEVQNGAKFWAASCTIGSMAWYHSGGILGSGTEERSTTPDPLVKFFRTQYLGTSSGSLYLSELTLLSILSTQGVLEKLKIPYQMGFIYDTQRSLQGSQEHFHGIMDCNTPLYSAVDWSKFTRYESPYEWAKHRKLLENDHYHPTRNAMVEWFRLAMNIDLQT